jgi:polyhydroxybutyrate depolymerase
MTRIAPCLCCLLLASLAAAADPLPLTGGATVAASLEHDGLQRVLLLHAPAHVAGRLPLVLALHGGSSSAAATERFTGFDAIADREGFIVAYPQGTAVPGRRGYFWDDDREPGSGGRSGADDVGFIAAAIDRLVDQGAVDPRRVFATGISNGAMMCHRLGREQADRIAAIAPVAGNLPCATPLPLGPARPVAVAMFSGTDDRLMPYSGGEITFFGLPLRRTLGAVRSAEASADAWVAADLASPTPEVDGLYGRDTDDGCTVTRFRHAGGPHGEDVWFYRIDGGGHTWPGSRSDMRILGPVCRDVDASEEIWAFFAAHGRAD